MTRVPRSPDPTDRLLAFAAELVAEVDDVDLDTIDGEFYWRWCRRDLSDTLERLTASLRLVGAPKQRNDAHSRTAGHALEGRIELESIYDFLRESMRFTSDFLEVADRASRFYPGIVWQRLLDGERVAMRTARTAVHLGDEDRNPTGCARSLSGAWTGMLVRPVRERGRIWAIVDHLPEEARDWDPAQRSRPFSRSTRRGPYHCGWGESSHAAGDAAANRVEGSARRRGAGVGDRV